MNQHKASNGASVHLDSNGRMTFRRDSPLCVNTLEAFWVQAAREFFQAERDEQLGRWRDPENPDMVCYPVECDPNAVWVVYEGDGRRYHATRTGWELTRPHYASEAAGRYFQAHPDPNPWRAAQPDEIWVLTVGEKTGPYKICTDTQRVWGFELIERPYTAIRRNDPRITAGRRIWPEPKIGGAE